MIPSIHCEGCSLNGNEASLGKCWLEILENKIFPCSPTQGHGWLQGSEAYLKAGVPNAPSQDKVLGRQFKIWLDLVSLQPGRGWQYHATSLNKPTEKDASREALALLFLPQSFADPPWRRVTIERLDSPVHMEPNTGDSVCEGQTHAPAALSPCSLAQRPCAGRNLHN